MRSWSICKLDLLVQNRGVLITSITVILNVPPWSLTTPTKAGLKQLTFQKYTARILRRVLHLLRERVTEVGHESLHDNALDN